MSKRKRLSDSSNINDQNDEQVSTPQPHKKIKKSTPNSKAFNIQTPKSENIQGKRTKPPKTKTTPKSENIQRKKAKMPKEKTEISKTNATETPKRQKVILKSPKTTPKDKRKPPKIKKGTPYPKKTISKDKVDQGEENGQVMNKKKPNKRKKKSEEPPNKKAKTKTQPVGVKPGQDESAKKERDAKSLFLKNFPATYTQSQIKALSPDIRKVSIKLKAAKKTKSYVYAFAYFDSEEKAKLNYNKLKGMKLGKQELFVNYVESVPSSKPAKKTVKRDKKTLFVTGLLEEVTESDLRGVFPTMKKAVQSKRHAFVSFSNEEDCKKAANDVVKNAIVLKGNRLGVEYANKRPGKQKSRRAKKTKKATKQSKGKPDHAEEDKEDSDDEEEDEAEKMDISNDDEDGDDDDEDDDDDDEE